MTFKMMARASVVFFKQQLLPPLKMKETFLFNGVIICQWSVPSPSFQRKLVSVALFQLKKCKESSYEKMQMKWNAFFR